MNILWVVGFRDVDSAATLSDIKLELKIVDNHGDDGLLTMDEFKLCHDILNQNSKSIIEAYSVSNLTFRRCVLHVFLMPFAILVAFFFMSFLKTTVY